MKLTKQKDSNINYLAKTINIKEFTSHPDPETTKLKIAHVDGFNIIVGVDSNPGNYIYFPTSCEINSNLLSYANLYRHNDKNRIQTESGFFEDNGRVKAIKLRGVVSEGFLMDWVLFQNFIIDNLNKEIDFELNKEFNAVADGDKEFWICKKYIVPVKTFNPNSKNKYQKNINKFDKVIDTQFRFHYETTLIRKCVHPIHPNDIISITEKIHGTSHISAYVLCKRPKKWYELFKKNDCEIYDYLYASRSVIKNQYYNKQVSKGYYNCDVWKYADEYLKPFLQKGMTIYAEIIGFLPNGGYIQKDYDYGCISIKEDEIYTAEKHFKVRPYRITLTNVDGQVHEFSAKEVQEWCIQHNLIPVKEYYYGYAKDLYPDLDINNHWYENFLERLSNDKNFNMEMNSPSCTNQVPHEGIVIKKENMRFEAFKLKCFKFLNKEQKALDEGKLNIEDNS